MLLNRDVLKPETAKVVEASGRFVVEIVDRWAGGWPEKVRRLERKGWLLTEAIKAAEREEPAREYAVRRQAEGAYLTHSEVLAIFDLPMGPPA